MCIRRWVVRIGTLLVMALLAACGGSGSGSSGGPFPPIGGEFSVFVTIRNEVEPNNDLTEADAHTLPTRGSAANYVGFGVIGAVDDTVDPVDYFVFTASRAHVFTVRMCPNMVGDLPSCAPFGTTELIDTSVAYFEVLDQSGTLLLSSQGDIAAGNFQEITLDAGIAYYLAVFAEDTVGATENYVIETVEKSPLA